MIYLTECPRDAMQGIQKFISTEKKIKYINQLIKVVFILLILDPLFLQKLFHNLKTLKLY